MDKMVTLDSMEDSKTIFGSFEVLMKYFQMV